MQQAPLINVKSEIAPLKKVLLHRPGKELEHLVPESLDALLFDDIPYLKEARREHDYFADVLRSNGVEVVYLEDLASEVLRLKPELFNSFFEDVIRDSKNGLAISYKKELLDYLLNLENEKEVVLAIMSGIREIELNNGKKRSLASHLNRSSRFVLDPIPNLYFTRDSFSTIGNGISLNRMYSETRKRETLFSKYIFTHHPTFKDVSRYYERENLFSIEGGDIFNLSEDTIMIGISQRTSPDAIELISKKLFSDTAVKTILAVEIPKTRAFMHLDTVLTQVDYDKFVIHPYIKNNNRLFNITSDGITEYKEGLEKALKEALALDSITLINCGGDDMVASEREQWNDGSNTLCIKPGSVIVYNRNTITNQILKEYGINTIEIPSSELSRGRGGPRCMSMPLVREDF